MVIGIFGESCVGKSSFAAELKEALHAEVFTGKDFLRLAKNEAIAAKLFQQRLETAQHGKNLIYVISEREHLAFLPEDTVRVLMTADLDLILERFAARMHGNHPEPVRTMLVKKHGIFDGEACTFHAHNSIGLEDICTKILEGTY